MHFSIRTLFLFTTAVAVTVASLSYASPIIGDLYYTLGLLTIAFATLAAIYRRGPQRAYWVGFVVLFAGYFCHTVWPSELRGTWNMMQQIGNLGVTTSGISTTRLLNGGFEVLHGSTISSSRMRPYNPGSRFNSDVEKYMAYMTIGHTAIAFLFGVIGGAVARRFALQSATTKDELIERAAASPPADVKHSNSL